MPRARCYEELDTIHSTATKKDERPNYVLTTNDYRRKGKEMVDYIADYLENIRERRVFPDVKPGYMRDLIPGEAPLNSEPWENIFNDIERVIMPGITHWQSPYMHAYFPALNSFASLLGDMLADAINCLGFTWASSPACTELEIIVMDWLGKMIGLPEQFLHTSASSKGGGVIQTTASESTFVSLLAARTAAIQKYQVEFPDIDDADINCRLVAYCSDQAHSSVEKAGLIGLVKLRYIESDDDLSMRGHKVLEAIQDDRDRGLIPFYVCVTLGTTGACSFDNLQEIGPICEQEDVWLHIDAAYAGTAFICPEFRGWMCGIEFADSLAFNPSKWMMVHFDCTAMWVRNSGTLHRTFNVDPIYLQHENSGLAIDYMGIRLAKKFEALVKSDQRFEIAAKRHLGMVVFRLRGENDLTEKLLKSINWSGKLHCVPASLKGKYVIRYTVTSTHTTAEDITRDWTIIRLIASEVLALSTSNVSPRRRVPLKDTRNNPNFGSSLLLANSPMSPKIVNGSFAAIFDTNEVLHEFAKKLQLLKIEVQGPSGRAMKRRIKGMILGGANYSLDSRMAIVHPDVKEKMATMQEKIDESDVLKEDIGIQTEDLDDILNLRSKSLEEISRNEKFQKTASQKFIKLNGYSGRKGDQERSLCGKENGFNEQKSEKENDLSVQENFDGKMNGEESNLERDKSTKMDVEAPENKRHCCPQCGTTF